MALGFALLAALLGTSVGPILSGERAEALAVCALHDEIRAGRPELLRRLRPLPADAQFLAKDLSLEERRRIWDAHVRRLPEAQRFAGAVAAEMDAARAAKCAAELGL